MEIKKQRKASDASLVSTMLRTSLVVSCALLLGCVQCASEKDLANWLLKDYDKRIRPVRNWSSQIEVTIQPQIYSLVDVEELREQITLLLWIPHSWKDDFLTWNATEWDGITKVNVPADQLWLPDGTIFNIIEVKESIPLSHIIARITPDGRVEVDLNKLVNVRCPMHVHNFPFDIQICELQFGSWGFLKNQLTHHVKDTFLPEHNGNSEWQIEKFTARKKTAVYESSLGDDVNEYEEVFYTLVLRRKPLYYVVVILIPTYLIVTVSIIGLFIAHSADGEREEKVSFGLTTLLTMVVVLDMVTSQMPRSSEGLPLLGRYVLLEALVSITAMLLAVGIMLWNERVLSYGRKPPRWVCKLVDDEYKNISKEDSHSEPLLKPSDNTLEDGERGTELERTVNSILQICMEVRVEDSDKNIWHRFFAAVDILAMISLIIFNSILTVITFHSVTLS